MNIPESTIKTSHEGHSESSLQAKTASNTADKTQAAGTSLSGKSDRSDPSGAAVPSKDTVNKLVSEMESRLEKNNVQLKFKVLEENQTVQVEILDGSGKTIRKIPSDELVSLSKSLKNLDRGFLEKVS
ncbi:flagellar protein FlaG [Pseudodesulfovibrio sp.]|uniref:flagellar protein FlaG n=1 Tax=unclassified Pseudodesulfovibrio TaxID=2661612 RepID=UPI003AFFDA91